MVALTGNPDGSSEVDYTVNPATGFPWATGPRNLAEPLNSVLPAWDVAMGTLATTGLLAAERHRGRTGEGTLVKLSLSDVAFAMVGNLGRIAEAQLGSRDQPKDGNYLYGAFGHDFETRDGRRVMVVALTARQWKALRDATGIAEACVSIEQATGHDLEHRDRPLRRARPDRGAAAAVVCGSRSRGGARGVHRHGRVVGAVSDLPSAGHGGPPRLDRESAVQRGRSARDRDVPHAGLAARLHRRCRASPSGPRLALGEHTEEVLAEVLGLDSTEIARLHDAGTVAGPGAAIPT